jgi:hypothetical protein
MSLVEVARFTDVYEADLAAAFLASHDIGVDVTERHQTTIDPLMQRALGLRLMVPEHQAEAARALLKRVAAGEFAEADLDLDADEDLPARDASTHVVGTGMALFMAVTGGFGGTSLPRRLRPAQVVGLSVIGGVILISLVLWLVGRAYAWA